MQFTRLSSSAYWLNEQSRALSTSYEKRKVLFRLLITRSPTIDIRPPTLVFCHMKGFFLSTYSL